MQAVIGAGVMGTALAAQLCRAGEKIALLATAFDEPFVRAYRAGSHHPGLGMPFPDVELAEPGSWGDALAHAECVVIAVSTAGLIDVVEEAKALARPDAVWVVGTKGWDLATLRSASAVVADCVGDEKRVVALVGPSLAGEMAAGVPTALVCASVSRPSAAMVADLFSAPLFRTYLSDDVAGVEVGAALKNVIAIGVGLCDGLSHAFGTETLTNTKAFLFARGLIEMAMLAKASGGRVETILGLAGAGDLFVSVLGGRNARFGAMIGRGMTPEEALAEMNTTVEGYANAHAAFHLAERYNLTLPVIRAVGRVLYEGLSSRAAIEDVLAAGALDEFGV
jgi:glycerol-3-phosphate dehydrogenase (NAD(P)+)